MKKRPTVTKQWFKIDLMLKKIVLLVLVLGGTLFVNTGNAQNKISQANKDSLDHTVKAYYDLNLIIFQENSTIEDIDSVFTLFTDDFTYVHPNYGGVYTREDLYNGYKRNLEDGGYDGQIVDVKIEQMITGLNAMAISRQYLKKEDEKISVGESQMTLFEFKQGKIRRIFEYW